MLSTVDALDVSPDVDRAAQTGLVLNDKTLPGWVVWMLALTLMLAPAVAAVDAFARARRRRLPVGGAVGWTLSCGLPFLACAVFARVLGWLGVVPSLAVRRARPARCPSDGAAVAVLVAVALAFVLAWLLWAGTIGRLRLARRPESDVGALAAVLVLAPLGLLAAAINPYTALLVAPAAHLLLIPCAGERPPGRALSRALVALALVPLALMIAFMPASCSSGRARPRGRLCCSWRAATSRLPGTVVERGAGVAGRGRAARSRGACSCCRSALGGSPPGDDPRPALLCRAGLAWGYGGELANRLGPAENMFPLARRAK